MCSSSGAPTLLPDCRAREVGNRESSGSSLLTGQPSVMMHIFEVQDQKREGKLGYIPRRQKHLQSLSRADLPWAEAP